MKNILLLATFLISLSLNTQASEFIEKEERKSTGTLKFAQHFSGIETKVTVKWIHENFLDGNEGMNFVVKPGHLFRLSLDYKHRFKSFDKIMKLELRHKVKNAVGESGEVDSEGFGYPHTMTIPAGYINSLDAVPLSPFLKFVSSRNTEEE